MSRWNIRPERSCKVVAPKPAKIASRLRETIEDRIRRAVGNRQQQIRGNAEDRIVVDVIEDMLPAFKQTALADIVAPRNTQLDR